MRLWRVSLVAGAIAAAGLGTSAAASPVPADQCAPLAIVEGGRYTGCFRSTDPAVPAITVSTDEPVTIARADIQHAGEGVVSQVDGTRVKIVDSRLVALDPQTPEPVSQRAVALAWPASFVAVHNNLAKGHGISILSDSGDVVAPLVIRFNRSIDIGRYGHPTDGNCCVQFVQLDKVTAAADIAWNHTKNRAGRSSIEDNINLYQSRGLDADHPMDVHDNLIDGAYPESGRGRSFTGGGIMLADGGGAYETARRNRVVSTTNYGVAITGGHDNHIANNWVVNDGRTDQGEQIGPGYGVGIAVWDAGGTGDVVDVDAQGNDVGWLRGTDLSRNDTWLPACDPVDACTRNRPIAGKITAQSEARQRRAWLRAAAAAGHVIGPR